MSGEGPMPYQITNEAHFIRVVFLEAITAEDLHELAYDVAAVDYAALATPRLVDLTAVSDIDAHFADLFFFAERRRTQPLTSPVRTAIVAPQLLQRGFAHMFQTLNDHPKITIQIFSTLAEAEAWFTST